MSLALNIKYYPWYLFFRDCHFWGPGFFLYFFSVLPLEKVLWLEAVYYVAVAAAEVPSGYLADRLGRRPALILSSLSLCMAYLLFFLGNGFAVFACGQLFLAAGIAWSSGADTALHFESLKSESRANEYTRLEARAMRVSLLAGTISALAGGGMALFGLKWMYLASFASAGCSVFIVMMMKEPERSSLNVLALSMGSQVKVLVKKAWTRRFRFFALYVPILTLMVHLPYEFYQPYLERVNMEMDGISTGVPFIAGVHLAAAMFMGSLCTGIVLPLRKHLQVKTSLVICAGWQVVLVCLMALFIHPLIVILLLGRTVSRAVAMPIVNGEVAPMLKQEERSTYLSLQSLFGRIGYGVVLIIFPAIGFLFEDQLRGILLSAAFLGAVLSIILVLTPLPELTVETESEHRGDMP